MSFTEELAVARQALADGNLSDAVEHLYCAIVERPADEQIPPLIEAWLDAAGERAEEFLPSGEEDGVPYDAAVILAFLRRRQGELAGALRLLLSVMQVREDADFSFQARTWASAEELTSTDPENLALVCSFDGGELLLKLQLELLTRIHGAHPQSSRVELSRARLTRILGDAEGALRIAEEQHARYPDYFSTIALGTNCKLTGDDGGALSAFEEALEHKPDDVAARLELGDLHLDLARWKLARDRYREALDLADDESWARPSWMFAELRLSDDAEWEKRLRDYTEQHPDNTRAQHLLGLCKAFRHVLPHRPEAVINVTAHMLAEGDPGKEVAISSMEAPSALVAVREAVAEAGQQDLLISFRVPDPDPRLPVRDVPFVLWKFPGSGLLGRWKGELGIEPRPGMGKPRARVASKVGALAARRYELADWSEKARDIGHDLGPRQMHDVVATMVHPPPLPPGLTCWDWRFRVQVAAAFVIARLAGEDFWASPAAATLDAILDGPPDWATTAAIVALLEVALRDEAARPKVIRRLEEVQEREVTPITSMCALEPAVFCLLQIPGLDDRTAQLRQLRNDYERNS